MPDVNQSLVLNSVDDQHRNIIGAQAVSMCCVEFGVMAQAQSYQEALDHLGLQPEEKI
ncbi:hypothetical protein [Cohaesibacter gelatinilyticus]|uniref:Uncharacterized protein n=1 Tax=Cohaesibacter gelatinilyticus TaxID=372072 RepID=A0A285PI29_9HYPH|nr:hypothetical protein [Cohaesibacter gelatinilyticus]SNZ21390.1 hypothetical protein SAMN06265368_4510 [Cohaesibacter gelatinilyticus]